MSKFKVTFTLDDTDAGYFRSLYRKAKRGARELDASRMVDRSDDTLRRDGYLQAGVEVCDDGNLDNTDACVEGCVEASCGDGFVHANVELCDDGNDIENDGCNNVCTPVPG